MIKSVKNSIQFHQDRQVIFLEMLSAVVFRWCDVPSAKNWGQRLLASAEIVKSWFLYLFSWSVFLRVCFCAGMRQGNDIGTTYRSAIYTYTKQQLEEALASKEQYQKVHEYICHLFLWLGDFKCLVFVSLSLNIICWFLKPLFWIWKNPKYAKWWKRLHRETSHKYGIEIVTRGPFPNM